MLFDEAPSSFTKQFDVVACFVECRGRFLMLLRRADKPNGNTWGLPAGKVDAGETLATAMARELQEETGITVSPHELAYHSMVPVRHDDVDFAYHMYGLVLSREPDVTFREQEHQAYEWFRPLDSLRLPLVPDQDECTRRYFKL